MRVENKKGIKAVETIEKIEEVLADALGDGELLAIEYLEQIDTIIEEYEIENT